MLAQKELAARLQAALDRLPFDQRTAIVLREIDGLSYDEIAFSLGVAVGTVKSRLTRARQALRLELHEARTRMKTLSCAADASPAARVPRPRAAGQRPDRGRRASRVVCASAPNQSPSCGSSRAALRATAPGRSTLSREEVRRVHRLRSSAACAAEHASSFLVRVREMFDDMHLVYAGVGAAVATIACVIIMLGMMRFATSERPDSLAAIVNLLATPGSNANPVALDARILMPRALDAAFSADRAPKRTPCSRWRRS